MKLKPEYWKQLQHAGCWNGHYSCLPDVWNDENWTVSEPFEVSLPWGKELVIEISNPILGTCRLRLFN